MAMSTSRWTRWITIAAVVLLAGIAAIVSYSHMYELALHHGEPQWRGTLFPLSVDGMVIASSMTLLNDARQGRRGGLLPWTLLVIGSAASLAANIAVAEPMVWSWIIHAWPSVALIGAYELLMRQFRANAACVRDEYAMSTQTPETGATGSRGPVPSAPSGEDGHEPPPRLQVVEAREGVTEKVEARVSASNEIVVSDTQAEAWRWALANRSEDGSLPTGREIAAHFDYKERWGRLIKQWGQQGRFHSLQA